MHSPASQRVRSWWPAAVLWAGLLAIVLGGFGPAHPPSGSGRLMRWQGAGRDWLLVADDAANRLVVYDATDGRLLRRLDPAVVGDVATLARRDGRLYVVGDDGARNELRLPQLTVAASGRR
ncbi:hypothetical protein [Rhodanobacter aciditrophus]|uniref:hypothetical protein n=1 Tax=Rhodanobacter aciditrophus TaxID=1623218 RepID=UPI003CF4AD6F